MIVEFLPSIDASESKLDLAKILPSFECFRKGDFPRWSVKGRAGEDSQFSEFSPACFAKRCVLVTEQV